MVLISEMSYVIMATMNTEHFVKAIVNLSYIRVVGVGDIKIFNVLLKRPKLADCINSIPNVIQIKRPIK